MLRSSASGACRTSGASRFGCIAFAFALLSGGCDSGYVNLGATALGGNAGNDGVGGTSVGGSSGGARWLVDPAPVLMPAAGELDTNPTLTSDLTLLFFSREIEEENDIWFVARSSADAAWGEPMRAGVFALNGHDEASPAISADGSELWFGSDEAGGLGKTDVWSTSFDGAGWGTPVNVAELNTPEDDIPRPPARATIMPLASRRDGSRYQLYLAERADLAAPWSEPSQQYLEAVDDVRYENVDGFLSDDALTLYFSSSRSGKQDLYVARRSAPTASFSAPELVPDVNTSGREERDPWLSPDGQQLFFCSDRDGEFRIYRATKSSD